MFEVKNEGQRATVYIYGTIGDDWWCPEDANRAKDFARTLDELSPKPLDIRIDSCGGDVYEGFAIAGAIERYEGETAAYVDGIAASAASYIALMADRVVMSDYAFLMIHNAWTCCQGNRDELRTTADRLEGIDGAIAQIVASRSGMGIDAVAEAMSAETWYTAEDAKAAGLCDEVVETEQRVAARVDPAIAGRFRNVPKAVGAAPCSGADASGEALPAGGEPEAKGGSELDEPAVSHAGDNMNPAEGEGKAIVLGNRVYRRKEN
ncbi:head maturation protease, ClpP-related [Adlercreutzia shanghongiae]|uniref:Head maturation protease, ClpP-related n=1 Tax=Adlercreutzia shanghongiae TaxID=3111773 RepID=A0ABU6IWW2_9ACTN|nr:head maturation protease, ClpP-related [Adlercreutzia sp. R22]MEC4294039.1 head maturation protease, ClpP-related [Adlercreutzia sp. R22]